MEVKLFWEEKTDNPAYKRTMDWGLLDAYHAPCRNPKNNFFNMAPTEWTYDVVESPRKNPWFLCTLGARRALTFLEQQPEVDAAGKQLSIICIHHSSPEHNSKATVKQNLLRSRTQLKDTTFFSSHQKW